MSEVIHPFIVISPESVGDDEIRVYCIELGENINRNVSRLLRTVTELDHAEGPIPNTKHFTNFAALERDANRKPSVITLRYNKRYETPNQVLENLPRITAVLENWLNKEKRVHPRCTAVELSHTDLNLIVKIMVD